MDTKKALIDSIKNRALFYWDLYRTLAEEYGDKEAARLMSKAIYRRGQAKADKYRDKVGGDFKALADAFLEGGDSSLNVFGNEVAAVEKDRAVFRLNGCPLVEAWREAGLSPEEVVMMCNIAYQVDFGKFEGLGFSLRFDSRICEGHPCCELVVTGEKK